MNDSLREYTQVVVQVTNGMLDRLARAYGVETLQIEIKQAEPNGNGHEQKQLEETTTPGICAWPGCEKKVTGVRCRSHAQLYRLQMEQTKPGRFRDEHQRAALTDGSYDLCECGRSKLRSAKECDVCRELNKHRQAPGR